MGGCIRRHRKPAVCGPGVAKDCCLNCDFLVRKDIPDHPFSIGEPERQKLLDQLTSGDNNPRRMTDDILTKYRCYRGVWEQGSIIQEVEDRLAKARGEASGDPSKIWDSSQVVEGRGDTCFFYPYEHRRRLEATVELEGRVANRREAEKDRRLTRRAFKVAIGALVISIIATVANLAWDYWKYHHPHPASVATSQPAASP